MYLTQLFIYFILIFKINFPFYSHITTYQICTMKCLQYCTHINIVHKVVMGYLENVLAFFNNTVFFFLGQIVMLQNYLGK
jgi:hypothetical protein